MAASPWGLSFMVWPTTLADLVRCRPADSSDTWCTAASGGGLEAVDLRDGPGDDDAHGVGHIVDFQRLGDGLLQHFGPQAHDVGVLIASLPCVFFWALVSVLFRIQFRGLSIGWGFGRIGVISDDRAVIAGLPQAFPAARRLTAALNFCRLERSAAL